MSQIILINGPSSAGKSTLARALREALDQPFLHFSFDVFIDNEVIPLKKIRAGGVDWKAMRPQVFDGYHHCLKSLADAGNNLIVDHIIEQKAWLDDLVGLLSEHDVFFVGVYCSVEELERRERARGDRRIGEARRDLETVHTFAPYDFELDAEKPLAENVSELIDAWIGRSDLSVFNQFVFKPD
ncbi:MAG: AAA family ATPase [Chloroflexota bacterium]